MFAMTATRVFGEALMLGLASGPACVASCGPVLVPSLLASDKGWRVHGRYLTSFLGGRLAGYLLFAVAAWAVGAALFAAGGGTSSSALKERVTGAVYVALAVVLAWYAWKVGKKSAVAGSHSADGEHCGACAADAVQRADRASGLVTIGPAEKSRVPAAALLGLLTGLSLCPPFVAAGVRAAQLGSLSAALVFFAVFFGGTSVWFVPFVGLGAVTRNEAVVTVARMTMALIALYYGYAGLMMLVGRHIHG